MELQFIIKKYRWLFILGVVFIMMAATATWVLAQTEGVINACVSQSSGSVRIVADPSLCTKRENSLAWNIMGPKGDQGAQGDPGLPGATGPAGEDGIACWDVDGDHVQDSGEDINQDGLWDTADCKGAQGDTGATGPQGIPGPQGEPGPAGPGITSLDDIDGLPCQVGQPGEGLTTLSYDLVTGNVTITCEPTTLYTITIVKTGGINSGVISDPEGISCGSTCSFSFPAGRTITLSNYLYSGDQFVGWGGACSGTADCQLTLSSDTTVTAEFVSTHDIQISLYFTEYGFPYYYFATGTVLVNGTQMCSDLSCIYTFADGETVTLQAIPAYGSRLEAWHGVCEGETSDTCTLTIDLTDPGILPVIAVFGMSQ